ncbi:MAG TPA: hypothetical protein VKX17_27390 [Planctomycetota bacterium]|nr:hypothetical protein [Planctomycetota bacterium]
MQRTVTRDVQLLTNHAQRTRMFGRSACSVIPLLAVGVFFLAMGVMVTFGRNNAGLRTGAVANYGGFFIIFFGVLLTVPCIYALVSRSRYRARAQRYANEPWLADFAWDPQGISDAPRLFGKWFFALAVSAVLAPLTYILFVNPTMGWGMGRYIALGVICLFDFFALLLIGTAVVALIRRVKYGPSRLFFTQFPFHLGGPLSVNFTSARPIASFKSIRFTLRFVQEKITRRQTSRGSETQVTAYQTYADTLLIDEPGTSGPSGQAFPLSFDLPDAPELATKLSGMPAQYWELEIHADTPGVDYEALFLLPVYSEPA